MPTLYTNPIWKDTYYTSSAASARYRILMDGETIFSGKAVKYPDADNLEINLNKVCRNYLETDILSLVTSLPTNNSTIQNPDAQKTFNLYVGDTNVADYRFYQDWSYNTRKNVTGTSINVSEPINGHFVPGMLKLRTYRNSTSSSSTVSTTGNTGASSGLGYTTQVKCAQYALYYLNSYGGWDSFVIEGTVKKKDAFDTFTTDRVYKNTTREFEYNKYVNEIKTSYELNTGYLTDEQSENLAKNLIGSVRVYLHDIPGGKVMPVVIDDKNVTYQTYQRNGRKMCQYKINVTESQSKLRK